jgi:hypothetical protein
LECVLAAKGKCAAEQIQSGKAMLHETVCLLISPDPDEAADALSNQMSGAHAETGRFQSRFMSGESRQLPKFA